MSVVLIVSTTVSPDLFRAGAVLLRAVHSEALARNKSGLTNDEMS
jgi:hypothetical protein